MKRILPIILLGAALFAYSCSNAKAENTRKNLESWFKEVLSPAKTSLEKASAGYSIKGNLKNQPNNLIILWERKPTTQVFIDSVRTNASGDFEIKGNTKEPLICELQWGSENSIFMIIDNNTAAKLQLSTNDPSYSIEGKGIESSVELKELLDLNIGYALQLQRIEQQAQGLPNTQEGYNTQMKLQSQYYQLMAERNTAVRNLALGKSKSLIPYFVISFGMLQEVDADLMKHAVESSKSYNANCKYTRDMEAYYNEEKKLAMGAVAPDFTLATPKGDSLSLSSLRGQVVLIDFWASWCGPCRRENPFNTAMYKKFKPKGFEIIGVSLDDNAGKWKSAIATDSLTWYHVSDLRGWGSTVAKKYKVSSIPATYLLDKNGKIIAKGLRGKELEAKLEEVFSGK